MQLEKILCLHGYQQNGEIFKNQMGSWRKALKNNAEFTYIDGPIELNIPKNEEKKFENFKLGPRAWWLAKESATRPSKSLHYLHWDQSLDYLNSKFNENPKIDGILGFSQGALALSLYLAFNKLNSEMMPKYAIFIGGFLPRDQELLNLLMKEKIKIPSLHIYGKNDKIIESNISKNLMERFDDDLVLVEEFEHPGGHMMPTCSKNVKEIIINFLNKVNVNN